MARGSGLAHFIAGFGASYLKGLNDKAERDRQAKMDQIVFDRAEREKKDYADKEAMEGRLAEVSKPVYQSSAQLDAQGLQGTMPGTFDSADTAQNFIDNQNATPTEKARVLENYAKLPESGANLNGQQIVAGDNGGVAVADPATAQTKPAWQIMQDKSRVYLESGKPEYQEGAVKMLEYSQKLKSQDYQQRILDASKGGVDGLLKLLHDHPNDEMNLVNPRIEHSADGRFAQLVGEDKDGQPIQPLQFNLANGTIEDQITRKLMYMTDATTMLKGIETQLSEAAAARKESRDERRLDQGDKRIDAMETSSNAREDRRDARQERQIAASDARQMRQIAATDARNDGDKITPTQEANNKEIKLARKRMAGMSMDDVKFKTQEFLPNGRTNPAYDPVVAQAYRTSNQRMVGDDPEFDKFSDVAQPIKKPAADAQSRGNASPKDRFKADPAMKGMTMGKFTANGWEVRDAKGQLIGHFQ